jgi:hypothetical protein
MDERLLFLPPILLCLALGFAVAQRPTDADPSDLFRTAESCMGCHNGLATAAGEDVSIGFAWRASMMANSARDPYWQAAVRREVIDYPDARESIEHECSICHMPMASFEARATGGRGQVFAHLPIGGSGSPLEPFAADGVSCTVCHQIESENFGTAESFNGGFEIDRDHPWEERRLFGPFEVDSGRVRVMRSATAFQPTEAAHVQQSELCATCHTLYTHPLAGEVSDRLPEQMPFLEWTNSDYGEDRSCQSCHMPVVSDSTAITAVLGQPREGMSRHDFLGGNFFMLRMLNRYRDELGVTALPQELEAAATRTEAQLRSSTAGIVIDDARVVNGILEARVTVSNLTGHKLPTAYPSRRVWIEFAVRDGSGASVFTSGAFLPDGSIAGNDNDRDPARFEPHYISITEPEQVQIYESVMEGPGGAVTTGLLTAAGYVKDNRLLPAGMTKEEGGQDVAVIGDAVDDADFEDGGDRVAFRVGIDPGAGPFRLHTALWYQPIGHRWAENLRAYAAPETDRFSRYYDTMAAGSAIVMARDSLTVD